MAARDHGDRPGRATGRSRGQILPIALFAMVATGAILILLFNTGQRLTEKSRAVNAADAATYSAAVWTARHLNLMAYTNRAMIANHVAVGHLTTYIGWLRYADNAAAALHKVATWFPPAEGVAQALDQTAGNARQTAEPAAGPYITAIDQLHRIYHTAQRDAYASLLTDRVHDLMEDVAQEHRPAYAVNDGAAVGNLPGDVGDAMQRAIRVQDAVRRGLARRLDVGDRRGSSGGIGGGLLGGGARGSFLADVVELTWERNSALETWIEGDRAWKIGIPKVVQVRKDGDTDHSLNSFNAGWRASDELELRTWKLTPFPHWSGWTTLARGQASADGLGMGSGSAGPGGGGGLTGGGGGGGGSGYTGMRGYFDVTRTGPRGAVTVPFVALVSIGNRVTGARTASMPTDSGLFTIGPSGDPITAAGVSETYFQRPPSCSAAGADPATCVQGLASDELERPNLFNPFWKARRVDFTLLCNQRGLLSC